MEYCSGLWEAPPFVEKITSPLSEKRQKWATLMYQHHPDKELTSFLLRGLETGFRIGYARKSRCISSSHNLLSCWEHPEEVQSYIDKERALGRVLGSFPQSAIPRLHVSPFGVIPKKVTGTWRLIVDLSSPHGASVNDGIPQELASLSYVTVDMIADRVAAMGRGTLLAKLDIKSAFRIIPVHPSDRVLLGMQWRDSWYVDTVLPFVQHQKYSTPLLTPFSIWRTPKEPSTSLISLVPRLSKHGRERRGRRKRGRRMRAWYPLFAHAQNFRTK